MSAESRNRLDEEASPYLRQHADNPVHWQPWDEDALADARERDVPIFLSVGYAACHWCHVMAEESFDDEAVAEVLNERYVPIKVDREERPDVDSVYQTICQMVTRGGGWPLSVWLTPDGRPFYVGTYFPPEESHGRPGFRELLEGLAETWENDREEVEKRADQWMAAIEGEVEDVSGPARAPDEDVLLDAARSVVRGADREHGGFGTGGPKFPQPSRIDLLLRAHDRTGDREFLDVAVETLDAMASRGMYDHVGGGFHRYATDRAWSVPHFEKMLYDNAELPRVYLDGYRVTGAERYARVTRETLDFLERELSHPGGGFYSTLDAQSERGGTREEGAFYVWTPDEVREAIDDERAADLFVDRFGITTSGNFEGSNVLALSRTVGSLAEEYEMDEREVEEALESARERLFEAREERPRPARDEKVLAGWNGLAISAFAEAGLVLDGEYAERAEGALAFVREHLWDGSRLKRRYKDVSESRSDGSEDALPASSGGDVRIDGYLEDYAFLARGALDCHQATGDVAHLAFALDLADAIEAEFWDAERNALFFTPESGEELVARPQELTDQSTPSSAGVAIDVLLALSHFVAHDRFRTVAEGALETYGSRIDANPSQHATLALAADRYTAGSRELTVVADAVPEDWRDRIGGTYLPARLLTVRPPEFESLLERLGLDEAPPIWAGRDGDGEPTLYACRDFACSPPTTDVEEALAWFEDVGQSDSDASAD